MSDWCEEKADAIVNLVEVARFDDMAYLTVEDLKKMIANAIRSAYFKGRNEKKANP